MAYIDTERIPMISEILRTARTRKLKQQQQADSLRPGTEIGRSEMEDLNRAVEGAEFYEVLSSQTECTADGESSCDCPDCEKSAQESMAYAMLDYKPKADVECDPDDPCDDPGCVIPLSRGLFAKVDADDFDTLNKFKWHATDTGYAARRDVDTGKCIYMHRQLLGLTERNVHGDHINFDRLDNRRVNLRTCSQSENNRNLQKSLAKGSTSRFKGVSWDPRTKKWRVTIVRDGKQLATIRLNNEVAAARAYNDLARKHHGRFASLNTIPCPECEGSLDQNECCESCTYGHLDCVPTECDTCLGAYIDQAEREADAAREME